MAGFVENLIWLAISIAAIALLIREFRWQASAKASKPSTPQAEWHFSSLNFGTKESHNQRVDDLPPYHSAETDHNQIRWLEVESHDRSEQKGIFGSTSKTSVKKAKGFDVETGCTRDYLRTLNNSSQNTNDTTVLREAPVRTTDNAMFRASHTSGEERRDRCEDAKLSQRQTNVYQWDRPYRDIGITRETSVKRLAYPTEDPKRLMKTAMLTSTRPSTKHTKAATENTPRTTRNPMIRATYPTTDIRRVRYEEPK